MSDYWIWRDLETGEERGTKSLKRLLTLRYLPRIVACGCYLGDAVYSVGQALKMLFTGRADA
jgi:hypothetical protein